LHGMPRDPAAFESDCHPVFGSEDYARAGAPHPPFPAWDDSVAKGSKSVGGARSLSLDRARGSVRGSGGRHSGSSLHSCPCLWLPCSWQGFPGCWCRPNRACPPPQPYGPAHRLRSLADPSTVIPQRIVCRHGRALHDRSLPLGRSGLVLTMNRLEAFTLVPLQHLHATPPDLHRPHSLLTFPRKSLCH